MKKEKKPLNSDICADFDKEYAKKYQIELETRLQKINTIIRDSNNESELKMAFQSIEPISKKIEGIKRLLNKCNGK